MQAHEFTFLNLACRSSKLREESNRLNGISEGLLEDSQRLRDDAAELRINAQNDRARTSPPAFRSYSNRP